MTSAHARHELKILTRADLRRSICLVVGTRPGIVKQAPTIRALRSSGIDFFIVHSGQHYSYEMDAGFFSDLRLPEPAYRLDHVRNYSTHGGQTAEMLKGIEAALLERRPAGVIVGGDANTNLAGALAARKLQLVLGHVEAGLRSYDWRMPEEHNRVMIDHISDLLFAPTESAQRNLERERVRGRIVVTGNTIVDAVMQNIGLAREREGLLPSLGVRPRRYFVLTVHREESVDNRHNLASLAAAIAALGTRYPDHPILFPVHPRTARRLDMFGLRGRLESAPTVRLLQPLGYLDFLLLTSQARLVLTDSGGIQEEACILGVPCVTVRDNTERPETLEVGANALAGVTPDGVVSTTARMLEAAHEWTNPFGDGRAAERIVDAMVQAVEAACP